MQTRQTVLATLACAVILSIGCGGADKKNGVTPKTGGVDTTADTHKPTDRVLEIDPRIRVGELDNGLTYYVLEHPKPGKRAQLWLGVNAGSVLEDPDQLGLAHFVEHMAFNGTKKFEKQAIVNYLEGIGMKFGPDLNAYTSFDETVYMLQVPTDDAEIVDRGLEVLHEWAGAIAFDNGEVDKERGVVLEEHRRGRGAWKRLIDKQYPVIFKGSRYAERLPIGSAEIIQKAPREALVRYYRDWYRPDMMAVVAVGDFDGAEMEKKIKARFANLPAGSEARARPPIPVPDHAETLVSVETDPEMPNTSITIYNKIPKRSERTVGDYRRFVLEQLYHGMLNSRLSEIGQGAGAPFTFAYSNTSGLNRSVDGFVRSAQVKSNKIAEAMQILVDEVERVNRHGFTAGELERAKKDVARSYEQLETERDKRHGREFAAEILRNFFEGEMMPGIKAERALVADFLGGIELAELNKLAASWGGAANRVVTVSGPPEAASIERDKILAIVDGASERKLDPYSDDVDRGPLMADKPAPGKITATKEIAEIGVTVWTLANGVEVVVKPTDFKNDEVMIQASSPGGTSVASDAVWPHARFAGQIVSAAGIGRFDQVQLGKYLTGKVASVNAFVGELEEGLWGNASPADLETAMQMIHQRFVAPRRDPEAFATWQSRMKEFLRNRRLSPQSAFFEDMGAELSSRHPRRLPPTPEAIAAVDLDKALAFYKERFADASDFRFVIVGNVDLAALKPLVETYLGSLPALKRNDKWRDVGVKPPRGVKKFSLDRGVEQKSFVYLAFHGPQRWSKQADNDLTMLVETLRIRLREVMREDMGGVYGVSPFGSISRRPKQERNLSVFFGCDPDNVDKLVAAIFDELQAIGKKGIDESYVEKIKTMRIRQREVDLETNRFWSRALDEAFTYGEDPTEILEHKKWVDQVSSKRIKAAARKYGSKKQYFLGVLYPEKKSE